jgi:hypothetical protein
MHHEFSNGNHKETGNSGSGTKLEVLLVTKSVGACKNTPGNGHRVQTDINGAKANSMLLVPLLAIHTLKAVQL